MDPRAPFLASQAAFQAWRRLYKTLLKNMASKNKLNPNEIGLLPIYKLHNRPNRFSDVYYYPATDTFYVAKHENGKEEFEVIPWDDGLQLLDDNLQPIYISWNAWNENRDSTIDDNVAELVERGERCKVI
jgi:hypothetical protein